MTKELSAPAATLSLQDATRSDWDSIVVGAGPAGAMAALQMVRRGLKVLLVDRAQFPRWKVCGCCVNLAAIDLLNDIGIQALDQQLSIQPLNRFQLASRGRHADVPMAGGFAISRTTLDGRMISAAMEAGADFLDGTLAHIQPGIKTTRVHLKRRESQQEIRCRIAIVATGLGGTWHCHGIHNVSGGNTRIARRSRIGAGASFPADSGDYAAQTVYMACDRRGYVGVVRLEQGELDVAAALDPDAIRESGNIGRLITEILGFAGLPPIAGMESHRWRGTQRLTQHRQQVWGRDYFLIGDAAGYVEPFTGEGMAWAMATGRAVAPLAASMLQQSSEDVGRQWQQQYRQLMSFRQRKCRVVSLLLRRPALVNLAVWALAKRPGLARGLEKSLNRPFPLAIEE